MTEAGSDSVLTERLLLRRYLPEDLDAWHQQIFADPEVMRYLPVGNRSSRPARRRI